MELQQIAQLNNANNSDIAANTGKRGLIVELSQPEHLIMMPKQFVIPKDTVFDAAYVETKVEEGIFTPIIGASAFEDVSADDAYNTNSSGVKRLNLKGLVEHKYTFEEGHEFYKQLQRIESYKSFSFAIGDDEGNWSLAKNSNGDYIGFTATHVTPERRMSKVKGGDNEMKSLLIQFNDRKQWDSNYDVFLAEQLDFTPEEIPTVNGVNTSFVEAPAVADVDIDVAIVLSSDHSTPVEGLETGDITLTSDGVDVPVTAVTPSATIAGEYNIEFAALTAADELVVGLDGIVNKNGVMYRGNNYIAEAVA